MYFVYVKNLKDPDKPWPNVYSSMPVDGAGKPVQKDILQSCTLPREQWTLPLWRLQELYPYIKKEGSDVEEPIRLEEPVGKPPEAQLPEAEAAGGTGSDGLHLDQSADVQRQSDGQRHSALPSSEEDEGSGP